MATTDPPSIPPPPENDVIPRVLWPSVDDIAYVRSMGSCLRVAAPFPPRCYLASISPGGEGGGTAKRGLQAISNDCSFPAVNKILAGLLRLSMISLLSDKFPSSNLIWILFILMQRDHRMTLHPVIILFMLVFIANPSDQSCGQSKSSEMHFVLKGHAYNSSQVADYPSCLMTCVRETNCVSCNFNFMTRICDLNSKTKATEPGSFKAQDYSVYTEMLK